MMEHDQWVTNSNDNLMSIKLTFSLVLYPLSKIFGAGVGHW